MKEKCNSDVTIEYFLYHFTSKNAETLSSEKLEKILKALKYLYSGLKNFLNRRREIYAMRASGF
ncbi:MAG: hypothetical protein H0X62_07845 [Bacteroidetes bacterium]|nr:hypothetical protein [Bacteroidota bacterium]